MWIITTRSLALMQVQVMLMHLVALIQVPALVRVLLMSLSNLHVALIHQRCWRMLMTVLTDHLLLYHVRVLLIHWSLKILQRCWRMLMTVLTDHLLMYHLLMYRLLVYGTISVRAQRSGSTWLCWTRSCRQSDSPPRQRLNQRIEKQAISDRYHHRKSKQSAVTTQYVG